MTIQQRIDAVIEKRKNDFLPKVMQRITHLEKIQEEIENLDFVIAEIKKQQEDKSGPYYSILMNDVGMESRLSQVSTIETKRLIQAAKVELERLKKRFSRECVSIQVFGMAGNGKSTFIQSVTGLTNDVVLASEGNHVTGSSSNIYNSDHFEARVNLYTKDELLKLFNDSLVHLIVEAKIGLKPFTLNSFNEIGHFKLSDYGLRSDMENREAVLKYVDKYSLICNILAGKDEYGEDIPGFGRDKDGRSYIAIDTPADVQKWVAQHNGHHQSSPQYIPYYNYLAVHHVDIYKKFNFDDVGKIVLMDNVGLGDNANDISTEARMYQAIADDSDAVILLWQPAANSKWRGEQKDIDKHLGNMRYTNAYTKTERMDVNELYLLLNERTTSGNDNSEDITEVKKVYKTKRNETILTANVSSREQVRDKAIIPILEQLTENLAKIDERKVQVANEVSQKLYLTYKQLAETVSKVVLGGSSKQSVQESKKLRKLMKSVDYSEQLRKFEQRYAENKDKECAEVKNSIMTVINTLLRLISRPDEIEKDVTAGEKTTNMILEMYCTAFRNSVYDSFAEVNTSVLIPLQDEVKNSVADILFNNAKFGKIPLNNYSIEDGPSQLWLATFVEEKVDKEVMPKMYEMLRFILDYQLNIQGLMEYHVAKCLETVDKHSVKFKTMSPIVGVDDLTHAKKIWSEIINRVVVIQKEMAKWSGEFSLIPSHSFYARISMFRDKMVEGEEARQELEDFYDENRYSVWHDEFENLVLEESAFGQWNAVSKNIMDLCKRNDFVITLNS